MLKWAFRKKIRFQFLNYTSLPVPSEKLYIHAPCIEIYIVVYLLHARTVTSKHVPAITQQYKKRCFLRAMPSSAVSWPLSTPAQPKRLHLAPSNRNMFTSALRSNVRGAIGTARRKHRFVYCCVISGSCFEVTVLAWSKYATILFSIFLST
jgi:hypothetical protein